jgi:hypothetical protein
MPRIDRHLVSSTMRGDPDRDLGLGRGQERGAASGTTWGSYHVVGTFDGTSFTIEEVGDAVPSESEPTDSFASPCPEPDGGWAATDATRTSEQDRLAAVKLAEDQPDHTASWIDHIEPDPSDPEHPGTYVLVLGFTGDLERHRSEAAALWGGPLCVFQHLDHSAN